MQSVPLPLIQELESLGISIKHIVDNLNDEKELENVADKLRDEFLKEKKEMEEKGLFVKPRWWITSSTSQLGVNVRLR